MCYNSCMAKETKKATPKKKKPDGTAPNCKTQTTIEEVERAISKCRGNLSAAARALKVTRTAVVHRLNAHPHLKELLAECREAQLDFAEAKLEEKIKKGETVPLLFYLKCQGKARGFVERQEITGRDGGPIAQVEIQADSLSDDQLANIAGS